MQDEDIAATLTAIVKGSDSNAYKIGHLIPRIFQDKDMARSKLMQLIQSHSNIRFRECMGYFN